MNVFSYLLDPAHWTGSQGIPVRLLEHVEGALRVRFRELDPGCKHRRLRFATHGASASRVVRTGGGTAPPSSVS